MIIKAVTLLFIRVLFSFWHFLFWSYDYQITIQRCHVSFILVETTCKAQGDPHYTSFDGKRFDFMGKCEYVLAKDRVNNTFEIRQENEPCGNGPPTCTKSLTVFFPELTIKLQRGMYFVDGEEITFSTSFRGKKKTLHFVQNCKVCFILVISLHNCIILFLLFPSSANKCNIWNTMHLWLY